MNENYQITKLPNYQITKLPNYQITKLPNYQITKLPMNNFISYLCTLIAIIILGGCSTGSNTDFFEKSPSLKLKAKSYQEDIKIDLPRELGYFRYQNSAKPVLKIPNGKEQKIVHLYGLDPSSSGLIGKPSIYQGVKLVVINPKGEVVNIANPVPFVDPLTYIPIIGDFYSMTVHLVLFHIPTWIAGGGETKIPADHSFLAIKKSEFSKSKIKKGDKLNIIHDNVPLDFKTNHQCKLNNGSTDNYLISLVVDNIGSSASNYQGKLFISKDNDKAQGLDKIQILETTLTGAKNANGDLVFSGKGIFGYTHAYSLTLHKSTNFLMPYEKMTVSGLNCADNLTKTFVQNDYLTTKNLFYANDDLDFVKDAMQIAANKKEHDGKVLDAIERKKEEQRQIALAFAAKQAALRRIADFNKNYTVKVVGKSAGSADIVSGADRTFSYLNGVYAYACRTRYYSLVITPKIGAKIYKNARIAFNLIGHNLNNSYTETKNITILNSSSKVDLSFNCVKEYTVIQNRDYVINSGGSVNNNNYDSYLERKLSLSYEVIQVD